MSKKYLTIFCMCSLSILSACEIEEIQMAPQIKAVKTVVIDEVNSINIRTFSGVVQTVNESVLSFRVSGRVIDIRAQRGDTVKAGDVLAILEQKDYELEVNAAQSKLQSAISELTKARQENTRKQNLLMKNFVSKAAAEQAAADFEHAKSSVQLAKNDMQTAQENLARTILTAPFDGKIADQQIDVFHEVLAGETIFVLQGSDGLEVETRVPESLVGMLHQGDAAQVTFPTLKGVNVNAKITQIGARSESGNAFPLLLRLSPSRADIRPGITAEVKVGINKGSISNDMRVLIPTSAVDLRFFQTMNTLEAKVFVFNAHTSTLELVIVKVENIRGNELEVSGGLKPGDRVVVAGVAFLNDGQKVKLWNPQYSIPATLGK